MPKFTIEFTAPEEIIASAVSALAELYGGYRATIIDPTWRREEGKPDEPPLIENPESIEDFVRRNLADEIKRRVVAHNAAKAAAGMNAEAATLIQKAADSVQVSGSDE